MTPDEIIDVEHEEISTSTDLERIDPAQHLNLFQAQSPEATVTRATATADALKAVIDQKQLFKMISGKRHVLVEGWTLLGSMLGVFPVTVWTRPLENDQGWEARVEARTAAGNVVGAAEAECSRSEANWKNRDSNALRSMAQTRATSKALRQPLGFVMTLAGYEATPSDEMPSSDPPPQEQSGPKPTKQQISELNAVIAEMTDKYPKAEGQKSYVDDIAYFAKSQFDRGGTDLSRDEFQTVIEYARDMLKDLDQPIA